MPGPHAVEFVSVASGLVEGETAVQVTALADAPQPIIAMAVIAPKILFVNIFFDLRVSWND
jgi:hypothetical protein